MNRWKEFFLNCIRSRTVFLLAVFLVLGFLLLRRVYVLQIVEGADRQREFELSYRKERSIASTRGNIYDVNGQTLAYNELAHSITIEDVYESGSGKNEQINRTLKKLLDILRRHGERISCEFDIYLNDNGDFAYDVTGTRLSRFLADVYGHAQIQDLTEKEKASTAADVVEYLGGTGRYAVGSYSDPQDRGSDFLVGEGYGRQELLDILSIRYAMSANSYQKFLRTTIAKDVSEETVAIVKENSDQLLGVDVEDDTIRHYPQGIPFSQIIGYTGKISTDELTALNSAQGMEGVKRARSPREYTSNDIVGKAGIERVMEEYLQGTPGREIVFVDRLGKVMGLLNRVEPVAGNDVYLTIDADLQTAVYGILEKFLAGILVEKLNNIIDYDREEVSSTQLVTPIGDVYNALFQNGIIDTGLLAKSSPGQDSYDIYQAFLMKRQEVFSRLQEEMLELDTPYESLSKDSGQRRPDSGGPGGPLLAGMGQGGESGHPFHFDLLHRPELD